MVWSGKPGHGSLKLFIHVEQRRGDRHAGTYGKRQPMRLTRAVIGILAQNDHFHIAQFGVAKGVEHIFLRRVNRLSGLALSRNGAERIDKIGLLLFFCQHVMPG